MWIVGAVIAVTLGLGIVGLILPSRGVHQHIRERKREELARIRQAIASEREGLFSSAPGSTPAPRMPSLLAYEARIESVREWPFDTTTVSRFGFFLLIPLVSWIGGALVERVVDAALQ
jgi:anti-sigma factor RsiW